MFRYHGPKGSRFYHLRFGGMLGVYATSGRIFVI
jgi:hypothetical protein